MEIYNKTEHPIQIKDDDDCSVDVFTCDEDGLLNLGFYDYADKKWRFHTDTLQDYDDIDFMWMYAPKELEAKAGYHK